MLIKEPLIKKIFLCILLLIRVANTLLYEKVRRFRWVVHHGFTVMAFRSWV
jgi:hypothetical protein